MSSPQPHDIDISGPAPREETPHTQDEGLEEEERGGDPAAPENDVAKPVKQKRPSKDKTIPERTLENPTGTTVLPISRIKKIIKLDEDVHGVSGDATFLVSVATEMFIDYLTARGLKMAMAERKPRKTLQYKDLANAVSKTENLEFLSDVIPQILQVKQTREKKAAKSKKTTEPEAGQLTLGGKRLVPTGGDDEQAEEADLDEYDVTGAEEEASVEGKGKGKAPEVSPEAADEDVEMQE